MSNHPYAGLADRAFWKKAVASHSFFEIKDLWRPKFEIRPETPVATYGSCFAQHIGRSLRKRGFEWNVTELAPPQASAELGSQFGYDVFSSRTGNIYTTSMLLQWVEWATGRYPCPEEFWYQDGRVYDPFRPSIEPDGFLDEFEAMASRLYTVEKFRESISSSQVFVFTLGLIESWWNRSGSYEYASCPGTTAGQFDPAEHVFCRQNMISALHSLESAITLMRELNPELKILLTVSPVPLTATQTGEHVLVATSQAKSLLRTVAAEMQDKYEFVDYFPSYEIISHAVYRGSFYKPNLRQVTQTGVDFVMDQFFAPLNRSDAQRLLTSITNTDVLCDEELLAVFAS